MLNARLLAGIFRYDMIEKSALARRICADPGMGLVREEEKMLLETEAQLPWFFYAAGVAAGAAVGAGVAERSGRASYTFPGRRDLLTSRCEIFAASHSASMRT